MTKLDVLMAILGVASYIAIMVDLRSYEQKLADFETYQEKRRVYLQNMNHKRKEEIAREKALEKKSAAKAELNQIAGAAEKLGSSDV